MAGAWPEPGRSYWPEQQALFIFFSPAPAKLWIRIERLKFSKFLLNIFIYFCDADNVVINSQSVTVASVLCTNTIELQLFWQNLQRPLLKRFD